jgi:hypothetical protein
VRKLREGLLPRSRIQTQVSPRALPLRIRYAASPINYEPAVFSGNILYDCHIGISELDITFSKNLSSVSLLFETLSNFPVTFTLSAFTGGINGMEIGAIDALGAASATRSALWSGPISFNGPPFDSIKLTSVANDWAIDQVNVVGIADAPEPATLVLAGLTLIVGTLTTRVQPMDRAKMGGAWPNR